MPEFDLRWKNANFVAKSLIPWAYIDAEGTDLTVEGADRRLPSAERRSTTSIVPRDGKLLRQVRARDVNHRRTTLQANRKNAKFVWAASNNQPSTLSKPRWSRKTVNSLITTRQRTRSRRRRLRLRPRSGSLPHRTRRRRKTSLLRIASFVGCGAKLFASEKKGLRSCSPSSGSNAMSRADVFALHRSSTTSLKIFGPREQTSSTTSARLQRWAIFLGSFDYEIHFKKSADH